MWRVLDDSIEVSAVFQIHWFLPYWQMHGGIEEEHPVIACPHHTPREKTDDVMYSYTHTRKHNPTAFFFFLVFSLRNANEEKHPIKTKATQREMILGHTWQLRMTKTRWDEFHPLIQISGVFLSSPTIFFFFFPQSSFISFTRFLFFTRLKIHSMSRIKYLQAYYTF